MSFPLIATLVLLFLTVAFSLQNDQPVSITFFKWTFEGSLVLILLTTLCLGIGIHSLASMPARIRKSQKIAELNKRVMELENTQQADVSRTHLDVSHRGSGMTEETQESGFRTRP